MRAAAALVVLLIAAAPAAPAEIYRWVDERGVVNYGSKPPEGAKKVRQLDENAVTVSTIPAPPPPSAERQRQRELALEARVERLERELYELERARSAVPSRHAGVSRVRPSVCRVRRRLSCLLPRLRPSVRQAHDLPAARSRRSSGTRRCAACAADRPDPGFATLAPAAHHNRALGSRHLRTREVASCDGFDRKTRMAGMPDARYICLPDHPACTGISSTPTTPRPGRNRWGRAR